jgi:hypothetical protein
MKRAEAIVRRGERRRGFVPYWLRFMAEVDVDFLEAYERIYELTAVRKGALPPKFVGLGGSLARLLHTMTEPSEQADTLRRESPFTVLVPAEDRRRIFESLRAA